MTDDGSFVNSDNLKIAKIALGIGKDLLPFVRKAESKGLDAQYAAELNSKISDMQFALIDAQSDALASQEAQSKQAARIRELEQAIAEFENWEAEKARYKLVNASGSGGVFVYLLRKETAEGEPLHYICPKCYEDKIKSIILQSYLYRLGYLCPKCGTEFQIDVGMARSHGVLKTSPPS